MNRRALFIAGSTLLVGGALAAAADVGPFAVNAATPGPGEICVVVEEIVGPPTICGPIAEPDPGTTTTSSTSSTTSSTSTTLAPTTTTVAPTTTTLPPTTTTVRPTTTTTTEPFVLPPTRPFPEDEEFNGGESFQLQIQCTEDPKEQEPGTPPFVCPLVNGKRHYADLDYFGHGMPYLYDDAIPGQHMHAWWVPGDRQGYACAYAFMYDQHPNPFGHPDIVRDGTFIAKVSIARPPEAGYGKVNDRYMEEGQRYYDGTHAFEGQEINSEDCLAEVLDPFDYAGYEPHGPDQIRIGLLKSDGQVADIRDFTDVLVDDNTGHFEFIGLEDGRATVVFILKGLVSHVIYYDALNDGQIVVEVDGEIVAFSEAG